jgi:hypothetical protein
MPMATLPRTARKGVDAAAELQQVPLTLPQLHAVAQPTTSTPQRPPHLIGTPAQAADRISGRVARHRCGSDGSGGQRAR